MEFGNVLLIRRYGSMTFSKEGGGGALKAWQQGNFAIFQHEIIGSKTMLSDQFWVQTSDKSPKVSYKVEYFENLKVSTLTGWIQRLKDFH